MTTYSVNVGSSITLTVTFQSATGGPGNFNSVNWSFTSIVDPNNPTQSGGIVNITPAAPSSSPTNTTTAQVTGVHPGLATVTAVPDTNPEAVASCQVNVVDTSSVPVSGTIT